MHKKHGNKTISGFSKLSKRGKIKWIVENFFRDPEAVMHELKDYLLPREDHQKIIDTISENTITNFPMPYSVAPNFIINGEAYCIPMVIEESSVVAAASSAAKFWMNRGGFKAEVLGIKKIGQLHFLWKGKPELLQKVFPGLKARLREETRDLTANMERRGGGILDIGLRDLTGQMPGYYQIFTEFDTKDSMGANFINTILERFGTVLEEYLWSHPELEGEAREVELMMAILSNYTPECLVRAEVQCTVDALGNIEGYEPKVFAMRFKRAIDIAHIDPYRAATHNKGIFNGIDAVVLATGNDFRAVEACGHTFAAREGRYRSLSHCTVEDGVFRFWLDLPISIGTVGGLTKLHPIARRSLELLNHPTAEQLMKIVAATGLAQNFAAIRSLVTTGIQKGHMKMHLHNILFELGATETQIRSALEYFEDKVVSYSSVRQFLDSYNSNTE